MTKYEIGDVFTMKGDAMVVKTIEFNTGRKYTAEGQFIKATLHDDGVVTFMDHSRGVDGEFVPAPGVPFNQATVMTMYDNYQAPGTARSWSTDGMMRDGCNARGK
jgi:hypothetical protein